MSDAPVTYIPDFVFDPDTLFEQLMAELDWVQRTPRRKEYWTNRFDRPYTYGTEQSGGTYAAQPNHPAIAAVSSQIMSKHGIDYEGCFLNRYDEARSGLEWHADDDPGIDHSRPIAVVTLGDGRAIQFKRKDGTGEREEVFLEPGSLLLMGAGMQDTHFHRIPKAGYVVKRPRISLTFRGLL